MKVEAEITRVIVAENGVIDVRYEVRGDKEIGISGNGIIRMREGLAVQAGQRLYVMFEPGPMVRHGKGQHGKMTLTPRSTSVAAAAKGKGKTKEATSG